MSAPTDAADIHPGGDLNSVPCPFPTSSWWARILLAIASISGVFVLVAFSGVLLLSLLSLFVSGFANITLPTIQMDANLLAVGVAVLSLISFYGMAGRQRKPWVYYTGAICLGYFTVTSATADILTIGDLPPIYGRIIATASMALLFGRFAFGRPSRVYYRVAKSSAPPAGAGVKALADQ